MKKRPLLTIPDEAKEGLAGKPQVAKPSVPTHPAIKRACELQIRYRAFGERMQPTLRERLLMYSSFTVLARHMP